MSGMKLRDQFNNPVVAGQVYGIGESKAALTVIDVNYDADRDELIYRTRKNAGPWIPIEVGFGQSTPKHCVLLDENLMEVTEDPTEKTDEPVSLADFVAEAEKTVLSLQQRLEQVEANLCDMFGVAVGDGSDLSDEIMMFVFDPDGSSPEKLMAVHRAHLAETCVE